MHSTSVELSIFSIVSQEINSISSAKVVTRIGDDAL